MIYDYKDDVLTNLIDQSELEELETKAINEVETIFEVTDEPYREKLVTSLVYMELTKLKLDNEEIIRKKYGIYEKEFQRYLKIAKTQTVMSKTLQSGELYRC